MIDNTPPIIPKESASWKGTILSIAFHALLFGTIWWVAMRHDSKVDDSAGAQSRTHATTESVATSPVASEAKPVVKEVNMDTSVAEAAPASSANETTMSANVTAKQAPETILHETKTVAPKQLTASAESRKLTVEKRKKRENELALAKKHAKQKAEALALQKKQRERAEQAELLAKKRAAEVALKMAAESQKRKEQEDQRALEKLHQEEMRRITNGLPGNG